MWAMLIPLIVSAAQAYLSSKDNKSESSGSGGGMGDMLGGGGSGGNSIMPPAQQNIQPTQNLFQYQKPDSYNDAIKNALKQSRGF